MKGLDKLEFKLPPRKQDSNKGTFGRVLNIAGSKYMSGAAYLSSVSALKTGCGYCFLACEDEVRKSVSAQIQNIVFVNPDNIENIKADVLSIGCGLTVQAEPLFSEAIDIFSNIPVVIDADGLNIIAGYEIEDLPKNLILTPHPLEASRLLKEDINKILEKPAEYAQKITQKYNCVTVLKGHNTVVTNTNGDIYINNTGNSALAKAGSGDVLTGIIAGFLAQKMSLFEGAKLGVYLHGLAGELASKDLTEYSVMAQDVINYIPKAIKTLI